MGLAQAPANAAEMGKLRGLDSPILVAQPADRTSVAEPLAAAASPASNGAAELPVKITVPTKRRVKPREVLTSLPIGWMLGMRDMKVKYKQSALGPLWLVLQPLGLLLAVTVAFSAVTSVSTGDVPYVVFALVGLAVWTYVYMTFSASTMTMPSNQLVVRRSPCPRVALVSGTLIAVLPPMGVVLGISVVAAAISGHLAIQALLMPVMIAWLVAFMWGVALLTSSLSARFRDVVAFAPLVLQAGIFLTPVGYPLSTNDTLSHVLAFNPVSGLIEAWRWSLLGMSPSMFAIEVSIAMTLGLLMFSWYVFGRMEPRFADYI
jgi:ABC-type polysaccharide/polyol phosphate export permease